jgi:NADPH-dependent ferric siderophore reductase
LLEGGTRHLAGVPLEVLVAEQVRGKGRFHREGGRHRFTARRGRVVSVTRVAPVMLRVRLEGADFADFVSEGPSDHARVYFPDPDTGEYNHPEPAGPGEDGIVRPEGPAYARDLTPLHIVRDGDDVALELDVFLHPSPGPASRWAGQAKSGDELVVVGPRGSRAAPQGASRLLVFADETALPAAARFAREVPASTAVDVVAVTGDDGAWVAEYVADAAGRSDIRVHHVDGPAEGYALVEALAGVDPIDEGTFVFAAGEASALLPLRRHLRGTLNLPHEQVAISGYWRRGVVAFDHHTPVDPEDPD